MSDLSRCPSRSSSLVSVPAGHEVQPVDRFSHPLSSDADDSTVHVLVTHPSLENVDSTCFGRHKAASIRSFKRDAPISTHRKTKSSVGMERTGSSSAPTPPNGRNLIFDEWITSTAHPALAAHELIPPELIDDEKAIQDMMAEAMTEETFCFVPLAEEIVAPVVQEAKIPEASVSVSTCEIPPKDVQVPSRPRSTSSLSLRKWAEMIVGRGETTRRPATASSTPPIYSKTGPARSFSAPEKPRSIEEGIEVPNLNTSPAPNTNETDVPAEPHNPPTTQPISPSSSNISVTSLNGPPASDTPPQLPSTHDSLSRVYSAPVEEIPTLEQMRTGVVKSIHTFRSPTRLRATTLTADTTRSRSGSESTPPKQPVLSQSSSTTSLTSWGQRSPVPVVEMNKIVPPGMQPPSQSAKWDDHYHSAQKGLTDRYGFVYAGERRRSGGILDLRESLREQTRSDEERWKDVVNEAEERIDELRKQGAKEKHVPPSFSEGWNSRVKADPVQDTVAMTERTVQSPSLNPGIPPSSPNETQSVELPPKISPESIIPIADPAPLTPSLSVPAPPIPTLSNPTDLSTIKLLLSKLNDLHDSLDRANRQRWDKWLSQSDLTDSLLTPSHNVKDRKQRLKDFKSLVIGGIPVKYRSKIWAECSGALELSRPGYFEELCNLGTKDLDQICVQQIEMDIHRTMPNNVFFGGNGPGIPKLERVLIAFARHNPEIGYCQGMNVITATLLLIHSTDDEAFWGLVAIIERILPEGYFTPDLIASRADQRVLKRLVRELCPRVHHHLQRLGVDLEAITFNWFLSVFTDCLPAEALFRVWDVFFVEGSAYMFRVALAVIKINEKLILACKSPAGVYTFMKDMTSRMLPVDKLISMSCEGLEKSVKNELIEGMRKVELEELRKEMKMLYQ